MRRQEMWERCEEKKATTRRQEKEERHVFQQGIGMYFWEHPLPVLCTHIKTSRPTSTISEAWPWGDEGGGGDFCGDGISCCLNKSAWNDQTSNREKCGWVGGRLPCEIDSCWTNGMKKLMNEQFDGVQFRFGHVVLVIQLDWIPSRNTQKSIC